MMKSLKNVKMNLSLRMILRHVVVSLQLWPNLILEFNQD